MNKVFSALIILAFGMLTACNSYQRELSYDNPDAEIIFLHHSTGYNVWKGDNHSEGKLSFRTSSFMVPGVLSVYNEENNKKYAIHELAFPSGESYPWENYPYDYYNIWIKNENSNEYSGEPRLDELTGKYDLIIFKHCYPGSNIQEDGDSADINSSVKTLANYKLQYNALKEKMHQYPDTKFMVWTLAAQVESQITREEALRASEFVHWVRETWDEEGDNIEIFDFYVGIYNCLASEDASCSSL